MNERLFCEFISLIVDMNGPVLIINLVSECLQCGGLLLILGSGRITNISQGHSCIGSRYMASDI